MPQIISLIRKLDPDIINSHFLSSFGLLAFLSNINKHIVSLQGTDILINARKNKFRRWIFKKVLDDSLHIFSVSEKITTVLAEEFKQPRNKITTIQYGVNTDIFKTVKKWDAREFDFITNRSFIKNSNYEIMLSVLGKVKKLYPEIKIRVIGSGVLENKILQWIEENDLNENVVLSDSVSEREMALLLNSSRFFLSFTSSDGTPLSLFEAAACGCYPILSDNESNIEWTEKGIQGDIISLYKINNAVTLLAGLLETMNENIVQSHNANFVEKFMNYHRNMKIVEKIIQTII